MNDGTHAPDCPRIDDRLAAAGALAAGAYLGLILVAGGTALRPAAMSVFDAVPPGAACAGLPACSSARR